MKETQTEIKQGIQVCSGGEGFYGTLITGVSRTVHKKVCQLQHVDYYYHHNGDHHHLSSLNINLWNNIM